MIHLLYIPYINSTSRIVVILAEGRLRAFTCAIICYLMAGNKSCNYIFKATRKSTNIWRVHNFYEEYFEIFNYL